MLGLALLVAGCVAPRSEADGPSGSSEPVTFDGVRVVTDAGTFSAVLFPEATPATAAFFGDLVEAGYYDGREFGRVIPGFVIQEADKLGGATDQSDTVVGEFGTAVHFSAGAFGIARGEDPDSGGSEFFVMDFAHAHLDGNYTAFAQVVEGIDVVRAIARVATINTGTGGVFLPCAPGAPCPSAGRHDFAPVTPPVITSMELIAITLAADVAHHLPWQVGPRLDGEVDGQTARFTPQWSAAIAADGEAYPLTWFVYTSPSEAPPDLRALTVRVVGPAGVASAIAHDADTLDGRILSFDARFHSAGTYVFSLLDANQTLAEFSVTV